MTAKEELLKQRVVDCIKRLQTCVDLNAPPVIIGQMAYSVWATVLAAYGEEAGNAMISHMRDQNLQERAVCTYGDCVNTVERAPFAVCEPCQKLLGCDDESMKRYEEEADRMAREESHEVK